MKTATLETHTVLKSLSLCLHITSSVSWCTAESDKVMTDGDDLRPAQEVSVKTMLIRGHILIVVILSRLWCIYLFLLFFLLLALLL